MTNEEMKQKLVTSIRKLVSEGHRDPLGIAAITALGVKDAMGDHKNIDEIVEIIVELAFLLALVELGKGTPSNDA